MERKTYYAPVTEALTALREKGYVLDFNLQENCIVCGLDKFHADEFDIMEIYRYEGMTDPGDEATVYAIQSKTGLKGALVTGYGAQSEPMSDEILNKLNRK